MENELGNVVSMRGFVTNERIQQRRIEAETRNSRRRVEMEEKAAALRERDGCYKLQVRDRRVMAERLEERIQILRARKEAGRLKAVIGKALDKSGDPARDRARFKYDPAKPDRPLYARLGGWIRMSDELAIAMGEDADEALMHLIDGTELSGAAAPHLEPFAKLRHMLNAAEASILERHDIDSAFAWLSQNEFRVEAGPELLPPGGWYPRFRNDLFELETWTDLFFSRGVYFDGDVTLNIYGNPFDLSLYLPAAALIDVWVGSFDIPRVAVDQFPVLQHWFLSPAEAAAEAAKLGLSPVDCSIAVYSRISLGFLPLGPGGRARLCAIEDPYLRAAAERRGPRPLPDLAGLEGIESLLREAIKSLDVRTNSGAERIEHAIYPEVMFRPLTDAVLADLFGRVIYEVGGDCLTANANYWDEQVDQDGGIETDHTELPSVSPRNTLAASLERNFAHADRAGKPKERLDRVLEREVRRWLEAIERERRARESAFQTAFETALATLRPTSPDREH